MNGILTINGEAYGLDDIRAYNVIYDPAAGGLLIDVLLGAPADPPEVSTEPDVTTPEASTTEEAEGVGKPSVVGIAQLFSHTELPLTDCYDGEKLKQLRGSTQLYPVDFEKESVELRKRLTCIKIEQQLKTRYYPVLDGSTMDVAVRELTSSERLAAGKAWLRITAPTMVVFNTKKDRFRLREHVEVWGVADAQVPVSTPQENPT